MPCSSQKIALIPAYKPSNLLLDLTVQLNSAHFHTVIVDDGSGDSYRQIFSSAKRFADVLVHDTNKGKGRALKTGLAYIKRHFPENSVIVTVDADGQHSINDAIKVSDAACTCTNSLILGCRRFGRDVPARSRFGNAVTRFVCKLAAGLDVSDTQTGLRAFGASLIPLMLNVDGERYEYEMNVLLECSRRRIPVKEVEIETIYFDSNSSSHFSPVKDSLRIYREIIKFAVSSLVGFAVDYTAYIMLSALTSSLGSSLSIPLSNILARIASSAVNYTLNRNFVFQSKDSVFKTSAQYFSLAALILVGNTLLLTFLANSLGINKYCAKILTEVVFFSVSWFVQKFVIFRKRHLETEKEL